MTAYEFAKAKIELLKETEGYSMWMINWVDFDLPSQTYMGFAPDHDLVAQHKDPVEFLKAFKVGCGNWVAEQDQAQEGVNK
jgi:hypothetical protein